MDTSIGSARHERVRRRTSAELVALGAVLGSLGRGLPVTLADITYPGRELARCDDDSIASCAVGAVPESIGQTFVFGLVVVSIAVALASSGALLLAFGFRNGKRAGDASILGVEPEQPSGVRANDAFSITIGSALLMPALWLLGSFAYFVLTGG